MNEKIKNVELSPEGSRLVILDQTRLPNEEVWLELGTAEEIYDAIFRLKVRGAPAIGVCAAYGIYILSRKICADDYSTFYRQFHRYKEYLDSSRPTAVNLNWALERMEGVVTKNHPLQCGSSCSYRIRNCPCATLCGNRAGDEVPCLCG